MYIQLLQDRFADGRARPPIDEKQDWELTEGREEGGFTTLYFTRPWITCDERDRDILVQSYMSLKLHYHELYGLICSHRPLVLCSAGMRQTLLIMTPTKLHSTVSGPLPVSTCLEETHRHLLNQKTVTASSLVPTMYVDQLQYTMMTD